jgi:hypothetical protein
MEGSLRGEDAGARLDTLSTRSGDHSHSERARRGTSYCTGLRILLRKALKEPESKSQQTNDDIVKALGGESIIRWISHQDVKL